VPWPGDGAPGAGAGGAIFARASPPSDAAPLALADGGDGDGAASAAGGSGGGGGNDDDDATPTASASEIRAFYCIDFSNSVYATVGIGGFLPLLIQSSAQAAAGFPALCANVVTNATLLAAFPGPPRASLFRIAGAGPRACDAPGAPSCFDGLCAGLPATVLECRDAAGLAPALLRTRAGAGGGPAGVDPTAFATLCVTASVVAQAAVFLSLGALADYGGARRVALLAASWAGAGACVLGAALVSPASWVLGLPVAVVTNVAFGIAGVMMNAALAPIVAALPDVRALPPRSRARAAHAAARASELSAKGFAAGYCAGVLGIALCVPLVLALPEVDAYRATLCLCGAWWAAFTVPVARWLRARPGPPLPGGVGIARASLAAARATLARLARLPGTAFYLLLWSLFSDAVFVVGTLGGLYANSRVDWGCTPKALGVLGVFILVPLCAALGNLAWERAARALRAPPERALVATLLVVGVGVPALGAAGVRTGRDVIAVACVWGACVGAMQAFSRAVFATLTPRGAESAFFALYEITNRGSSWVGPLVLTLSVELTGGFGLGFAYVAVGALAGAAGVAYLDVPRAQAAAAADGSGGAWLDAPRAHPAAAADGPGGAWLDAPRAHPAAAADGGAGAVEAFR